MRIKRNNVDINSGSVLGRLVGFAIPFFLSTLMQTLYNSVAMVVVGRYVGSAGMSGVSIGSQATTLITTMVTGLSVGATIMIGQYKGAKRDDALQETIGTFLTTLFIIALAIMGVMYFCRDALLQAIKTPVESYAEAKNYFTITLFGIIFIFGYNACSAILRGMGDSKRPLYFVIISCGCSLLLSFVTVGLMGMGSSGAAYSTVISQGVSMMLCILYLRKTDFIFKFRPKDFRIYPAKLKLLFKIGIPTAISSISSSVTYLFLQTMINSFGVYASAGAGAGNTLNSFTLLPISAISNSIAAITAQNIGAGDIARAKKTTLTGILICECWGVLSIALVQIFRFDLVGIYTTDHEAVVYGAAFLSAFVIENVTVPFQNCFNALANGSGHTNFTLINLLLSCFVFFVPASYLYSMVLNMGIFGVGLGAPTASFICACIATGYYFSGRWKKPRINLNQ